MTTGNLSRQFHIKMCSILRAGVWGPTAAVEIDQENIVNGHTKEIPLRRNPAFAIENTKIFKLLISLQFAQYIKSREHRCQAIRMSGSHLYSLQTYHFLSLQRPCESAVIMLFAKSMKSDHCLASRLVTTILVHTINIS